LIALALVPAIYVLTRLFQKRMLSAQIENLEQLGKVNTHLSESLHNIRMIKSFDRTTYMENAYSRKLEDNFRTVERVNFYDACYSPVILVIRAAVIALVVLLASDSLSVLGISLGMVAASIELLSNLFSPVESLGMELQNIQKGVSGMRRINDFYLGEEEPPKNDGITEQTVRVGEKGRGIGLSFQNVSFAYEEDQAVLKNLDLEIAPGSSVTFAGRTGIGKTTLFRLIMGLYKPTTGKILAGGVDVYEIPHSVKRRIFGFVEQQFAFIQGTVAEQVTLGDEKISLEEVKAAIKFVELHDHVMQMENGYNTIVHPDSDFSQGQKQLLAIARAIVTDPPVLLLDEVTANLDSAAEARFFKVLREAGQGRTVLAISHRITSMIHCDKLVQIEDGREPCSL
jgi:ATP-binding cassette subfamily B protein